MKGLEISEATITEVIETKEHRLDADFFAHSESAWIDKLLSEKEFTTIGKIKSYISSGHTPYKHDISQGNVKFITVECINDLSLDMDKSKRITEEQFENEFEKNYAQKGSVLCTIKRRICKAFPFIDEVNEPIAINQDVAIIIPGSTLNAAYLAVYLNCKVGQVLADKQKTGQMNPYISVSNLCDLPVHVPSKDFQLQIESVVKQAHQTQEHSKALYQEAETLLLAELGINNKTFEQPLNEASVNVKSVSAINDSWRLDAEYFLPKFEVNEALCYKNAQHVKILKDIIIYNARGLQPIYSDNGSLDVINSRHILENDLDYKNFEKTDGSNWIIQAKARVQKHDILTYTTGANIGRTQVYFSNERALASNHVNILRITDENPIYVAFVLNSIVGRLQTEKLSAGSAQQELYPKDLEKFFIPFVKQETQDAICVRVEESRQAKQEAEQLLTIAKRAVELAIETSEDEAVAWLSEQI